MESNHRCGNPIENKIIQGGLLCADQILEGGEVSLPLLPGAPSKEHSQTLKVLASHRHGDGGYPAHGSRKQPPLSMSL